MTTFWMRLRARLTAAGCALTLGDSLRWALAVSIAACATLAANRLFPSTPGVWLSDNTFLTITMITREALRILDNNLTFTKRINRQFDGSFEVAGAKIGTTLNVRKPVQYVGRTGQALVLEDITETSVPVTLDQQIGVDIAPTSQDLALKIDDFSERILQPAVANMANRVDAMSMALYNQIYNSVGTPGTTPNALLTYLQAGVALNNNSAPLDGKRSVVITPLMEATLVDALKGLFQQASAIADQYEKGQMGRTAGFEFYMDQNCATHTVGPLGGVPLVDGAGQNGASLNTKGWSLAAASRLKRGDVFTLAGVYGVNIQSRANTTVLQQFVVTSDFSSGADGKGAVGISPSIVTSGAYQTVTGSPADGAALTVVGAASTVSPQGLAFHADCMTLACADLPLPRGVDMAARVSDPQLGLSMRVIRAYDISLDRFPTRLDILFGLAVLRPGLACRVQG